MTQDAIQKIDRLRELVTQHEFFSSYHAAKICAALDDAISRINQAVLMDQDAKRAAGRAENRKRERELNPTAGDLLRAIAGAESGVK